MDELSNGAVYYLLWGGMGNQLFGLSNLYLYCKKYGKRAIIDTLNCEHLGCDGYPESLSLQDYSDWATFIYSSDVFLLGLKDNLKDISEFDPAGKCGYFGWKPDIHLVREAGLFEEGALRSSTSHKGVFKVGIHIRGGDYFNYPHLGLLTKSYYARAVKKAISMNDRSNFTFFYDDEKRFREIAVALDKGFVSGNTPSPSETLKNMANVDLLICANSTFSFWAAYLGGIPAVYPSPWYLSAPNWGKGLLREGDVEILQNKFFQYNVWCYQFQFLFQKIKRISFVSAKNVFKPSI